MSDRRRASYSVQSPLWSVASRHSQWRGIHSPDENRNSSVEEMDCEEDGSPGSISFTRHRTPANAKQPRHSMGSTHRGSTPIARQSPLSPPSGIYAQQSRKASPSSLFSQLHLFEPSTSLMVMSTPLPSNGPRYPSFHRPIPADASKSFFRVPALTPQSPKQVSSCESPTSTNIPDDSIMEISGNMATDDDLNASEQNSKPYAEDVCCGRETFEKTLNSNTKRKMTKSRWSVFRRLFVCFLATLIGLVVGIIANDGIGTSFLSPSCASSVDIASLERSLSDRVYGQHLAVQIVSSSIRTFLSTSSTDSLLVLSFHGWTGIGKNHMSNVIADRFAPGAVRRFIVPLHFPHSSADDAVNLHTWIASNVSSSCGLQLFVIDEVDKAGEELIISLHEVISSVAQTLRKARDTPSGEKSSSTSRTNTVPHKVIILLLSNTGGGAINSYVTSALTAGHARESITYTDLVNAMDTALINPWYKRMRADSLIDYLVPFLPLQRNHVAQCMETAFRSRGVETITEQMMKTVLDQLQYFPRDMNLFSTAGCRKVPSQVDLLLG